MGGEVWFVRSGFDVKVIVGIFLRYKKVVGLIELEVVFRWGCREGEGFSEGWKIYAGGRMVLVIMVIS